MNQSGNYCWRCGKERIVVRSWEEKVGTSVVTTTETACPDIECQKLVEKANKKRVDKFKASQLKRKRSLTCKRKNLKDKHLLK